MNALQRHQVHSFVQSFILSFIHSFTHSFIHSFIYSFFYSFIHSNIHTLIHTRRDSHSHTKYDAFLTSMPKSRTACFWGLFHYANRSKRPKLAYIPPPILTSYRMAKSLLGTKFQHPMGLKEPKKQVWWWKKRYKIIEAPFSKTDRQGDR